MMDHKEIDSVERKSLIEFFEKHKEKYLGYFYIAKYYGDTSDFKLNSLLAQLLHEGVIEIQKITERIYTTSSQSLEAEEIWGYRLKEGMDCKTKFKKEEEDGEEFYILAIKVIPSNETEREYLEN